MMKKDLTGFREVAHTADWALEVWAPDLATLFMTAAQGMAALMEIRLELEQHFLRSFSIESEDIESLLVQYLSELLYLGEMEGLGYMTQDVVIDGMQLSVNLECARIVEQMKEFKAVTFHNLNVHFDGERYEVMIVFDV